LRGCLKEGDHLDGIIKFHRRAKAEYQVSESDVQGLLELVELVVNVARLVRVLKCELGFERHRAVHYLGLANSLLTKKNLGRVAVSGKFTAICRVCAVILQEVKAGLTRGDVRVLAGAADSILQVLEDYRAGKALVCQVGQALDLVVRGCADWLAGWVLATDPETILVTLA
jgi:hypothetical protein